MGNPVVMEEEGLVVEVGQEGKISFLKCSDSLLIGVIEAGPAEAVEGLVVVLSGGSEGMVLSNMHKKE